MNNNNNNETILRITKRLLKYSAHPTEIENIYILRNLRCILWC